MWALLVEVWDVERPFTWTRDDVRSSSFLVFGGVLLLQLGACSLVLVAWLLGLPKKLNWEALSVATTALLCAATPWTNSWHCAIILGSERTQVTGLWGASVIEAEGTAILGLLSMAAGFSMYVPVRLAWWPVIPLCSLGSYVLLVATVGSQYPEVTPLRILSLSLLLLLPAGIVRKHELRARERWVEEQDGCAARGGADAMLATPSFLYDLTFRLTESLNFTRTTTVHDAFFGRRVEGTSFASFLLPGDRLRFQEVIESASTCRGAQGGFPFSLSLLRGAASVNLVIFDTRRSEADGRGRFVIGLRMLEQRRSVQLRVEPEDDDGDMGTVASVPEDAMLHVPLPNISVVEAPDAPLPLMQSGRSERSLTRRRSDARGDESPSGFLGTTTWMGVMTSELSHFLKPTEDSLGLSYTTEDNPEHDFTGSRRLSLSYATEHSEYRPRVFCATTQTEVEVVDAAVNTNIVMDELSFRCIACSKPPKSPMFYNPKGCAPVIPGPEAQAIIAKLDKKKGKRSCSKEREKAKDRGDTIRYKGSDFNGVWVAIIPENFQVADWLQTFAIYNGYARMGDGGEAKLLQQGEGGPVSLCGGELRYQQDSGRLLRVGRSGHFVEFVLRSQVRQEGSEASSTWSSEDDRQSVRSIGSG